MITVKLEVTCSSSGIKNNKLTLGTSKFDITTSHLVRLESLIHTYLEMDYVSDKVLESSI